ncbi:Transcriptional regulatory protein BtsR [Pseudoalteromonas sp. CIP111854]|uniref:Transcriptional regulatory protein BtsR n=1 Tax=Pseudoalteromonas holothuriae TaxID=2963714 RepID=A0A9W4R348_9GAMM|nr:LytTR family DNA-binding domain-containing protein [Pseudoalteromonas sp. CIP111854]CAH9064803.1 Transcriptional regulatory protein BtsR [Pseudoalteromonas sp. CIP111854]
MKYMVVDDEPLARQRIKRLIAPLHDYECIAETGKPQEVLMLAEQFQPQLILLDISMPGMDGLELAKYLAELTFAPKVIFISAHPEYALDAFKVFANGYLVKPVEQNELHILLQRLFPAKIKYTIGNQTRWVEVADILVARAQDKYTQLFLKSGQAVIDISLKQLLSLYSLHFVQVHRKTLVKSSAMQALIHNSKGYFVTIDGYPDEIAVSRRAAQALKLKN